MILNMAVTKPFRRQAVIADRGRDLLAVDPFFFRDKRPAQDEGVDGADVFADDAEGDELDGAEEKESKDHRSDPDIEVGPEDQLVDEIKHSNQEAEKCRNEAGKDNKAQRHLGKIRDAQHGEVIEGIEVLAGDAAGAAVLVIVNCHHRKAQFGDHSAKIRVRIAKIGANFVDYGAIVEPKSSEMGHNSHICEPRDQAVIGGAQAVHQPAFVAGVLDAGNDGGALLPGTDHVYEELGGVLEVGDEDADGVALGLEQGVHAGAIRAHVAGVHNDLDGGVLGGHFAQDGDRRVSGGVVDEEVLEAVLGQRRGHGHQPPVNLADVLLLVVAGSHDRDQPGLEPVTLRYSGLKVRPCDQIS